jgi:hypothetical protein
LIDDRGVASFDVRFAAACTDFASTSDTLIQHMADSNRSAQFPMAQWSRVIAAADRGYLATAVALAELCQAYWYRIYAFIRCRSPSPGGANGLAQDYFTRLLKKPRRKRAGRFAGISVCSPRGPT